MRRRVLVSAALAVLGIALAQLTVVQPAQAAASRWWKNGAYPNLCLDGSASQGVLMKTCDRTSVYQRWSVTTVGDFVVIKNGAYTNMCLDGSIASGARMRACNSGEYQKWLIPESSLQVHVAKYGTSYSLDGSASQGVRLNTTDTDSPYQRWFFVTV